MIKYVDALKARRELGMLMDRAQYLNEYTVIKRANKPIAAIVSAEFLEGIVQYDKELIKGILDCARRNKMTDQDALALGNEAKKFARQ